MQKTRPGEFIALIAFLTAIVAMSIDTMLPAIGDMAKELGARDPNDRHLIVLMFFAGLALGTLVFGAISDSNGRKPTIYWGLALYVVGCLVCYFSNSFPMLIAGRIIQGLGAASPRVVSIAMVRDGSKGADMARIMSYVMTVFMLVPLLAPSIGQLILNVATWHMIFLMFIVMAVLVWVWLAVRQEETLAVEDHKDFSVSVLLSSAGEVLRHPVSLGYTIAVSFVFAAFNIYLATSQQIFAEQYGQGKAFSLWFSFMATGIAMSMIFNGKYVRRFGMRNMSRYGLSGFVVAWVLLLAASVIWNGQPPLMLVAGLMFCSFFASGLTFGNYNAMAMEPMGHIAGMAAAVSGAISSLAAIVLGGFAARQYDGSLLPVAIAFVVYGLCAYAAAEWAEAKRPVKNSSL